MYEYDYQMNVCQAMTEHLSCNERRQLSLILRLVGLCVSVATTQSTRVSLSWPNLAQFFIKGSCQGKGCANDQPQIQMSIERVGHSDHQEATRRIRRQIPECDESHAYRCFKISKYNSHLLPRKILTHWAFPRTFPVKNQPNPQQIPSKQTPARIPRWTFPRTFSP